MVNANYSVDRVDHLGIVAGTIKDLGLVELIDSRLGRYEGETLSPGETVAGMIINGLGFSNKPLSLTPLFFRNCPLSLLFRDGVNAEDFNRFKLSRVLERLHSYGTEMLFSEISLNVCQQEHVENRFNHLDTSAFSLSGEYIPDTDEQAIHITYGHTKDHRPDLKQAMVEMMVSQDGGIPLLFQSLDGNSSDNNVFRERAKTLLEEFKKSETPRYLIADCKLYTEKNSDNLKKLPFITRIPQNIKKVGELIELAVDSPEAWLELDNDRQVQTFDLEHYGMQQRWHVVSSETSRQQADRRVDKQVTKEEKTIKKQICHLQAQRFNCEEDAVKEGKKIERKWKTHNINTYKIIKHKCYKSKGRPKKDEVPSVIKFQITMSYQEDMDKTDRARKIGGYYVIGTNVDQDQLSTPEVIDAYRKQSCVERGFRFLKDPLFFVSSLFIKKPSRISALLMVMVLSLLVYGIAERRMRTHLAKNKDTIPNQINQPTKTPTLRWVFQLLSGIHRIKITTNQQVSYVFEGISELKRRLILLFGETVASIYQIPSNCTRSM